MRYQESLPSFHLSHVVKHFWSLEQSTAEALGTREPVLPDGCPEVIFNLADRFRRYGSNDDHELQPHTLVAGQMTKRIVIGPSGDVNLFGVRFRPFGAYCLLGVPMSELSNRTDGLDLLMPRSESILREQLLSADSFAAKISVIEKVLTDGLRRVASPDSKLVFAVDALARNGTIRVAKMAAEIGWTERKLERDFKKYVGLSPKMFGRVSRFASIVRSMEISGINGLIDHAHKYGYYDQSHMINDFRAFAGESPTAFYARTHRLSELFTIGK